jgi:hypothetical protein
MSSSGAGAFGSMLVMRRRGVWEAADSGVLLWRKNFLYIIPFFAVPVWVAAFALRFVPENMKYLAWIGLWWLKPLFDRLVLHPVSARFFENPSKAKTPLLRGFPGNVFRGLLGDLLWRRFSFTRSSRMPIRVLERLKFKKFSRRKKSLAAGGLNFGSFVTFLCFFLEWFLLAGECLFIYLMFNMFSPEIFSSLGEFLVQEERFIFIAYCVNYMLVESLYVAMGFGVYINSRVETEGWDLQILFKKFETLKAADRGSATKAAKRGMFSNSKVLLALALGLFLFFPAGVRAGSDDSPAYAGEEEESPEEAAADFFPEGFLPAESVPREVLDGVLASPDFGYSKPGWGIRFRNRQEPEEFEDPQDMLPWIEKLKEALGFMLRILISLVIGGFAAFVLFRFFRGRGNFGSGKHRDGRNYRNPLFSPESPEALFEKAAKFFGAGNVREAWAACLRGVIAAYGSYGGVSFPPDATEYGCLALVRSSSGGGVDEFGELVRNWIYLAYGGRTPPEGSFERALAFGRSLETALPLRVKEAGDA